jgi:hypothetical protein
MAPASILPIDDQIAQLMPEGQAILASGDKQRARIWSDKMGELLHAKSTEMAKFSKTLSERSNAMANAVSGVQINPCLDAMGRDRCAAQQTQPQGGGGWCQVDSSGRMVPC